MNPPEDAIEVCNYLQNAVAITYIFALQQTTFWVCNFLHLYFTINNTDANASDSDIGDTAVEGDAMYTGDSLDDDNSEEEYEEVC